MQSTPSNGFATSFKTACEEIKPTPHPALDTNSRYRSATFQTPPRSNPAPRTGANRGYATALPGRFAAM